MCVYAQGQRGWQANNNMKQKIAHIHRRAQNWLDAHWRGDMPRLARIRVWWLSRQGDYQTAAAIWRQIAERAEQRQSSADAAVAWTCRGRCILSFAETDKTAAAEAATESHAAFIRAIELRPGFRPALESLADFALGREDWAAAIPPLRALLGQDLDTRRRVDTMRRLADALIRRGAFADAAAVIDGLGDTAGGGYAACELRVKIAECRWRQEDIRVAWRQLHNRFPAVADNAPGYWRLLGGQDATDAARRTAADLGAAKSAHGARLILAYLDARLPKAEYLDLYRDTADRFAGAPELQAGYIAALCWDAAAPRELAEAAARARDFARRFPRHAQAASLLSLTATAANDTDAVERAVARLWRGARPRREEIWLAAARGEWGRAKALDRQARAGRYILALDRRGLDLNMANAAPPRLRDKIVLFTYVRNEIMFLPWFLDYHRSIGVDWFFVVDNGSNDGGVEWLSRQKDVTVYTSADNFAATANGARWMNELIRRHGRDNWCARVDTDEQLVAPGVESGGLRGVCDGMRERGEEVMPAFMADTYPKDMAVVGEFAPGDDPSAASGLLDTDYFFSGCFDCCFFRARGGARHRLFRVRDMIEKAPILRGGAALYLGNHNTTVARVGRQCGVLLHHKILREALEARKTKMNEWRMADRLASRRRLHLLYRESGLLKASAVLPRGPHTVEYTDSAQLERLGLVGDFADVTGNETRTT